MAAKLEKTRYPGIYKRGSRYVIIWKHRRRQHKESFRTFPRPARPRASATQARSGRSRGFDFGGGPEELREFLALLSRLGAQREHGLEIDREAFARMQDLRKLVDTLLDIVLLSADSLATIKQTHSSYFTGGANRLEELLQS